MIVIKGLREGLLIVFSGPTDEPWLTQLRELEAKLSAYPGFFRGGSVAFDVKDRTLSEDDLRRSLALLAAHEVTLWAVLSHDEDTRARVRALGLMDRLTPPQAPPGGATPGDTPGGATPIAQASPAGASAPGRAPHPMSETTSEAAPRPTPPEEQPEGTDGLLVRRRVRSGQVLRHPGHIVVIGDVNPGAQLIAGGDIIVWGRLHGTAHAGALGDESAVVCALEMSPVIVRIADATRTARPGERRQRRKASSAEMARLVDQQIEFAVWDRSSRAFE